MQTDFMAGVSLLKREDESLYEYWLSFSPMAPFFGVPWRFAPSFPARADAEAQPAPRFETPSAAKPAAAPKAEAERGADAGPTPESKPAARNIEVVSTKAAAAPAPAEAEAEAAPAGTKPAMLYDPAPAVSDDLKRIKGIGPKLEVELNDLGLHTFAQIAALTPDNLVWIDERLSANTFKGRGLRDDWPGQAKALMAEV